MVKVTLVVPPGGYYAERWSHGSLMPSLGITYLATYLRSRGMEAEILDAHVDRLDWGQLREELRKRQPELVGFTFTTETRFEGFRAIKVAREVLPKAFLVAGGPHASLAARDTLEYHPELNAVVRGEGELTLFDLVKELGGGKNLETVTGLSFRDGSQIIDNSDRPFLENLDQLPIPDRSLLPWKKYNFTLEVPGKGEVPAGNIMTSRGCPFGCNFCSSRIMWGRRVRHRSPENILEEVRELVERYRVRAVWFFDDTFTLKRSQVEKVCDLLRDNHLDIKWFCEIRVDTVDRELLARMQEAGCYKVGFGVESASDRILREVIKKGITREQTEATIAWCKELGININPFFIFSHPTETWQEAQETNDFIRRLDSNADATISLLHIYPGTALEKLAREKGHLPRDFSWSRERVPGVVTLPSAQGEVPLFLDKLSWAQVSELLFSWAEGRKYSLWKKLPRILRSIRSFSDLGRYFVMFGVYVRRKLGGRRPAPRGEKKAEGKIPGEAK